MDTCTVHHQKIQISPIDEFFVCLVFLLQHLSCSWSIPISMIHKLQFFLINRNIIHNSAMTSFQFRHFISVSNLCKKELIWERKKTKLFEFDNLVEKYIFFWQIIMERGNCFVVWFFLCTCQRPHFLLQAGKKLMWLDVVWNYSVGLWNRSKNLSDWILKSYVWHW